MEDDHVQEASLFLSPGKLRPASTKRFPFHWMEAIELSSRAAGVIGWNLIHQLHPSGEMIPLRLLPPLPFISFKR